jgi:hypothetical protein
MFPTRSKTEKKNWKKVVEKKKNSVRKGFSWVETNRKGRISYPGIHTLRVSVVSTVIYLIFFKAKIK